MVDKFIPAHYHNIKLQITWWVHPYCRPLLRWTIYFQPFGWLHYEKLDYTTWAIFKSHWRVFWWTCMRLQHFCNHKTAAWNALLKIQIVHPLTSCAGVISFLLIMTFALQINRSCRFDPLHSVVMCYDSGQLWLQPPPSPPPSSQSAQSGLRCNLHMD